MYAGGLMSPMQVLQRYGLSTIGDIFRHRHISPAVARLDPGVPAHDALRLMVDTYKGTKPMASRRPPGRPRNVWLNSSRRMPIKRSTATLAVIEI